MQNPISGKLYIVATPIGNLKDLSHRAVEVLGSVSRCLAEDTRTTSVLLRAYGIRVPLVSFHEHNEEHRGEAVLRALEGGETLALVTDAGTPLLSDPGYPLVRACRSKGIPIEVVPGPSAITTALILSGFPPYPFTFTGFPPRKQGKRRTFWESMLSLPHSLVVFSTPHAIAVHLREIDEIAPDRLLFLGRELTKKFEEQMEGTASDLQTRLASRSRVRGEITLVIGPA
ncbi:MAG TPA: 16S rRNA (cytidine(1402)-2'-O)-methyltransferase [Thermoanaerobaculia bacterium]|nr:16S rRNA (cytidine(1402)-2'-O)-methyltransferase [Thermoanaerobaculia bacterium]HUM29669.1 16S rRNA (cytidine(1402)-2'-O)-methyltransferase [Thermoanaerobaculia bacterium]HXK67320.1 16S rRNA (cytidine(1402)-2'-O)-methyltransferase [Thermoanaerobaculia bacterium]